MILRFIPFFLLFSGQMNALNDGELDRKPIHIMTEKLVSPGVGFVPNFSSSLVPCSREQPLIRHPQDDASSETPPSVKKSGEPPWSISKFFNPSVYIRKNLFYFGASALLYSVSKAALFGWGLSFVTPWRSTIGNELLLFSHLSKSVSQRLLSQEVIIQSSKNPSSFFSWQENKRLLSQIPAVSNQDKQLLRFLEERWLAKANGFFLAEVDWAASCFGIVVQVHPKTKNSYARDPATSPSLLYETRKAAWQKELPDSFDFPLILTRPFDLSKYLPSNVVDLTDLFFSNRTQWPQIWETFQDSFNPKNSDEKIYIQQVKEGDIGAIQILPLKQDLPEKKEKNYQFLIEWISRFGLTATPIELARWNSPSEAQESTSLPSSLKKKEEFFFAPMYDSLPPHNRLLLKGTLQLINGLLSSISNEKWDEIEHSPTRSAIAHLSFSKIAEELTLIEKEKKEASFYTLYSHVEQILSHLSSLLEIYDPYSSADFSPIYQALLSSIPKDLKLLTSCANHASGMTSLAGILKAAGTKPRVLYGENTYFETLFMIEEVSRASPISTASEKDWEEVDLILAQFNPVLRRDDPNRTHYKVEKVADILHRAFKNNRKKPITLALDCTIDYINSPRVAELLNEFQDLIKEGILNFISYRSGLKFDLFGMDNYAGAPLFMIHNADPKWDSFDSLISDPVLQTDRLSANWFSLAYKYCASELELYRKIIFENTRSLLNKLPKRLLTTQTDHYRITPTEEGADPVFLDIKTYGLLHRARAALLIGGLLYLKCMERGHPLFYRRSIGFYHPNFTLLSGPDSSTIRLTLGLDPAQVDLFVECFQIIDSLNGPPN